MKKQQGFTLIELMIGITIGLILLLGAGGLFMTTLRTNVEAIKQQRFEQTVQVLMDIMTSGIRRAGYAKEGITLTTQENGTPANPSTYFASTDCVLLSNSTATENERFYGFKLVNNIVYMYSGITNSPSKCTSTVTGWTAVTDPSYIKVTRLWFDTGAVDLATAYNCVAAPVGVANAIPRVTLGVEAVGLYKNGTTPVTRCVQANVQRRNS